ncbi:hypothetical protein SCWH03_40840 [Streptomyces pacificus]|uniref:Uncharacterized protein n=1 Tax=Streptomyces pacificus TaxID=2705029 RepID=A0A6A0B0R1_9ACTN|nr:hypothetical protein SCWH03_40840 [Streptomyces pacificus]
MMAEAGRLVGGRVLWGPFLAHMAARGHGVVPAREAAATLVPPEPAHGRYVLEPDTPPGAQRGATTLTAIEEVQFKGTQSRIAVRAYRFPTVSPDSQPQTITQPSVRKPSGHQPSVTTLNLRCERSLASGHDRAAVMY